MRPTKRQQQLSLFDLPHYFVGNVAIDHQHALHGVAKVRLRYVMTAAGIEHVNDGVFTSEQPQPPKMARFPGLFRENLPASLVRMKVR